ncbi:MAG: hypothetical protein FWD36_05975 [Treponema sp.]|nr:hypothetical protein [Treponema sp.]
MSKKLSLALLLSACGIALGIVFLLHYALAGPKLGPIYDILLGFRPSPPVSGEIVRIETEEVIEPGDIFSVLMTLSEMGASDLLIEVPVLGTGSGMAESGVEFSYRINDEFNLLTNNIRNLFEGIRLGLVAPTESPAYVANLVELAERGRDRLNAAIIQQDEAGSEWAAQAAAVFGNAITATDLRIVPVGENLWYSRPQPDWDRAIRRVAPIRDGMEHIAYHALKPRWQESFVELIETGSVLINETYRFPLDRDGNILFERPGLKSSGLLSSSKNGFRRLTLDYFRDYDNAGRVLARLLKDAEALGVYSQIIPERIPLILFDYAESLKEELLKEPIAEKYDAWINARAEYIASLDDFLYGHSEMTLVNGYEELIADEGIGEEGIAKLESLRDELIRAFVAMREKHREFIGLRTMLAGELHAGFCIAGPAPSVAGYAIPESSALLANALLTGNCITPGYSRDIIFWSLVASFLVLICIHRLRPVVLLFTGLAVTLLCGVVFGIVFIINAYWIDPFIPTAACLGGTLFLFVSRFCISYGRALRFRFAYAGAVNRETLKVLFKAGRPRLAETVCAQAAIIAVKNPGLPGKEDRVTPIEAAKIAAEFREEISRYFRQAGAMVLCFEADTALACFGSPPEQIFLEKAKRGTRFGRIHPVAKAEQCLTELVHNLLLKNRDASFAQWRFGIEWGECAFSWSRETGCVVNGRPVVRAKIFASIANKFKARVVIGETAREHANLCTRKLSSLGNSAAGTPGESFYELMIPGSS